MTFTKTVFFLLGVILASRFVYTLDFDKSLKATVLNILAFVLYILSIPMVW